MSSITERDKTDTRHHEQTPSVQATFAKDVRSLVRVIDDLEESSTDLLVLDTKEICRPCFSTKCAKC